MAHPLDGARLKVIRAYSHLESLKLMAGTYAKSKIDRIVVENKGRSVEASVRKEASPPPPDEIRCIVGDCVNNARCALDYVLWEMVLKYFTPPVDLTNFNDRRITAFPISDNATDKGYTDRLDRLSKRGIPTAAIDEIKSVQPYNAWYEPLWQLHQIVNSDKHRLPVITVGGIAPYSNMAVGIVSHDGAVDRMTVTQGVTDRLEVDTSDIVGKFQVNVHSSSAVFVAISDPSVPREPADFTLEKILKCVSEIIPRFERFF